MNVWVAMPVHRLAAAADRLIDWRLMGYRLAVLTDGGERPAAGGEVAPPIEAGSLDLHLHVADYPGYARSINALATAILAVDPEAAAVVAAGYDIAPDPRHGAAEIGEQFADHFGPALCGVMQPTGDGFDANDCCAVSPWLGRGWIRRANGGSGPLWGDYWHYFVDKELFDVANAAGAYWRREDLRQHHAHWTREPLAARPPHLAHAKARNEEDCRLYHGRRAGAFPGSALLAAAEVAR